MINAAVAVAMKVRKVLNLARISKCFHLRGIYKTEENYQLLLIITFEKYVFLGKICKISVIANGTYENSNRYAER